MTDGRRLFLQLRRAHLQMLAALEQARLAHLTVVRAIEQEYAVKPHEELRREQESKPTLTARQEASLIDAIQREA